MDTYHGHVRTPADAIKLFEACRLGLLPRVQRRLSEKERQSIKSGSVFVWDEREAGMRRWTDGKSWSASRVSGSFLTYREMEGKRGGGQFVPLPAKQRVAGRTPDNGRGSDEDLDMDGDGPDGYRYKPDGLMKQSFSITTTTGQHLHLISYYSRPHANSPDLPQPTTDPYLRHIVPQKGMYPESTIHEAQGPIVTTRPIQHQGPYMQHSPHQSQHPQSRGPPPYPYQVSPGYAWPPSPMSTPPFPHYQGSMYNSALPPPPGSVHTSPYQHHSPHQIHLPPTSLSQQGPTIFDRPPPVSESSLPPPPPPSYRMSTATQAQMMPAHVPNPSPRIAQAALIAQQAQLAERAIISRTPIDPRLSQPLPPVHTGSPPQQLAPLRTTSPAQQQVPPVQRTSPQPVSLQNQRTSTPPQSLSHSQANTPSSTGRPVTPKGQNIPSISSLVHAEDSVSVRDDNKSNSSRAGSRSPKAGVRDDQTARDIPHEKLNILGEDQRAIRVLDRKFNF